jgi:hypothetical protein
MWKCACSVFLPDRKSLIAIETISFAPESSSPAPQHQRLLSTSQSREPQRKQRLHAGVTIGGKLKLVGEKRCGRSFETRHRQLLVLDRAEAVWRLRTGQNLLPLT